MYKKSVLWVCNQVVTPHEYFHSSVTEVCLVQLYNAVPQVLRLCNGGRRENTTLSQNVRTDYAVVHVQIPDSRNPK